MKRIFTLSAIAFTAFSMALTSCSNTDEPGNDGIIVEPSSNNVFTAGLPVKANGMSFVTNAKGQVTEIKGGDEKITLEYGSFTHYSNASMVYQAVMRIRNNDNDEGSNIYIQLDDNGFATYAFQEYLWSGYDKYWFGYNQDGQLSYVKRTEGDETYNLTYTEGNLHSAVKAYPNGPHRTTTRTTTFYYVNDEFHKGVANKGCLMLFDAWDIDLDEMEYAYYAGMLGRPSNNLPMAYHWITDYGDVTSGGTLGTYHWTIANGGLPTSFKDSYSFDTIIFSWK